MSTQADIIFSFHISNWTLFFSIKNNCDKIDFHVPRQTCWCKRPLCMLVQTWVTKAKVAPVKFTKWFSFNWLFISYILVFIYMCFMWTVQYHSCLVETWLSLIFCSRIWNQNNAGKWPFNHVFAPNGGYCLYYPSNLFRNARSFENWGIFSDISQFQLGNTVTWQV